MARHFSAQKKMVERALLCMDHPTAAQVYENIRRTYPRISLGTVYRNLNAMEEDGDLTRLSFPGAPDRFDHNAREHVHLVCSSCGKLMDAAESVPAELLEKLDEALLDRLGFAVRQRELLFRGMCADCALRCSENIS